MFNFLKNAFDLNKKEIESLKPVVEKINSFEKEMAALSDEELAAKTPEFKLRLSRGETLDDLMPEALAVIREAIKRQVNQRAFDVQLMAAISLHHGKIAEQKTGEGKTLSAAMTAYVNSLSEKGVHIVTTNDYLARVGTGWYGRALSMLGLKVSCIIHEQAFIYDSKFTKSDEIDDRLAHLNPISRKEAYDADVTYGTNNEFGFDYLRDNLVFELPEMAQRGPASPGGGQGGHHFAIVDEVDSILVDEARTPLIISAPDTEPTSKYYDFARLVGNLSKDIDYTSDEKSKTVSLTELGLRKIEKMLGIENLYEKDFESIHLMENALKAKVHYLRDRDYVVKDGEVIIVDEFTGRLMQGRRWSDGLHQSVEAKEGAVIQQESKTLATISFQNYFRMYEKLAGMTGTAATEAEEFKKIYNLEVVVIPTNQPMQRKDFADVIYKNQRAKYAAIAKDIEDCYKTGQPVLVGTTSVSKNEIVDQILNHKRIPHKILNAKQHQKEAEVISQAGAKSAVTIATNMAGRGVDIVLGGAMPQMIDFKSKSEFNVAMKDWEKKHKGIVDLGGLHVIGTERHESRRIDNQLRGRSGRQGDPGSSRFFIALDDDLMRIFGGDQISSLMTKFNMPEDVPLEHGLVSRAIEQAQVKVEGFNFDMRKQVVEYDDVMNKQREVIYRLRKRVLSISDQGFLLRPAKNGTSAKSDLASEGQAGNNEQSKSLKEEILEKIDSEITNLVAMYSPEGYTLPEFEKIVFGISEILPFDLGSQQRIKNEISKFKTSAEIAEFFRKMVKDIYENREKVIGSETGHQLERFVYLSTLDKLWVDHLTAIDDLREGIGLRGYGQRDPLVEYKKEAFEMFEKLLAQLDFEVVRKIFRVQVTTEQRQPDLTRYAVEKHSEITAINGTKQEREQIVTPAASVANVVSGKTSVGRNDPCPCGSGKKYKKCCYPKFR